MLIFERSCLHHVLSDYFGHTLPQSAQHQHIRHELLKFNSVVIIIIIIAIIIIAIIVIITSNMIIIFVIVTIIIYILGFLKGDGNP